MPCLTVNRKLSAFNSPGRGLVILKSYYDGSGQSIDPGCRFVTLAGYAATDDQWLILETAWESALRKYSKCPLSDRGNPYFHAKEAFHRHDGYANWSVDEIQDLLTDLYEVFGASGRQSPIGFSCTVSKADYETVRLSIPALRTIEKICLDFCITNSFRHPEALNGMEIYFDRNESFEPILRTVWNGTNGQRPSWANYVLLITPIENMRYSYALQAADLLAWTANRYYTHGEEDDYGRNFFSLNLLNHQVHVKYDEPQFRLVFNQDGTIKPNVELFIEPIKAPSGTILKMAKR